MPAQQANLAPVAWCMFIPTMHTASCSTRGAAPTASPCPTPRLVFPAYPTPTAQPPSQTCPAAVGGLHPALPDALPRLPCPHLLRGGEDVVGEPVECEAAGHVQGEVACRQGHDDRASIHCDALCTAGRRRAGAAECCGGWQRCSPAARRSKERKHGAAQRTDHDGQELEDGVGLLLRRVLALLRGNDLHAHVLQAGASGRRNKSGSVKGMQGGGVRRGTQARQAACLATSALVLYATPPWTRDAIALRRRQKSGGGGGGGAPSPPG